MPKILEQIWLQKDSQNAFLCSANCYNSLELFLRTLYHFMNPQFLYSCVHCNERVLKVLMFLWQCLSLNRCSELKRCMKVCEIIMALCGKVLVMRCSVLLGLWAFLFFFLPLSCWGGIEERAKRCSGSQLRSTHHGSIWKQFKNQLGQRRTTD